MAGALIATKVHVPKLRRGLVARPRLLAGLRRGTEARLTLVSAPAGFGKTTLLAEWLDETPAHDRRVAWLSLDLSDNESASFWPNVLTALHTAVPGIGSGALELMTSLTVPIERALTSLLNDLAEASGEIWLVLDDYHLVEDRHVHDGVTFLLEHLPPPVHMVLSTRADPDLPLARWRARGELVEIRATELRFTPDETTAYLNDVTGLDLRVEDITALEERTEGWIAALQLAALSIRGREDVTGFISRFTGNDRYIVDYLVEEVLQHQPEPVREFLLHSAVLDRLSGPLCDAVTGRNDSSDLLVALERANLFVVPLDDWREWYRYHHLFADVLRARMLVEQPDLVPVLHQRASQWYVRHDLPDEAITHAMAGRDFDRAAYLMEVAVPSIRRSRHDSRLLGWLKELPDHVVRRSPVLSVFTAYMLMVSGDLDVVEPRLDDAERALTTGPDEAAPPWADTVELRTLPATIAIHRASLAQARGDVAGTAQHARRALELAGPTDHLARGGAAGFLGLAAWAQGDVSTALATFTQAVASLHAAGNLVDELNSTVVLADLWLLAGRPGEARRLYHRGLERAEAHGDPVARATAELHVGLSELESEVGDRESARRHLQSADALDERLSMTESRFRRFVAMSRVVEAEGDPQSAISLLDQAEELYRPGFFPDVRPIAAMKARMWIRHGDLLQAGGWAEREVSATDDVTYLNEFDHLTLVRLLLARHRADQDIGRLDQAVDLLDRLREAAQASGRAGSLLEIRLLHALAHDARGQQREALETLAEALAQVPEPEGYGRLFIDEGAPMLVLLRAAQRQGVAGDHPRRLLRIGEAAGLAAGGQNTAPPAGRVAYPLSEREVEVLRLLAGELSGPQIARALFVSNNTLRTHTKHIFTKLEATSRRAAVRRARERGLL